MQSQPARGNIAALDGVRGVAIISVLAYHFGTWSTAVAGVPRNAVASLASVGYSGVDLFFVLSGFLISGILLDARGTPGWVRSFYARRLLRIFPLYYAAVAVAVAFSARLTGPQETLTVSQAQPWLWLHAHNVNLALRNDWSPLVIGHFWSLGVEEQFYAVWPWVVALLPAAALAAVCVVLIPAALGLRLWLFATGHPLAAYVLMPCRADALCMGALVAIAARSPGGLARWRRPAQAGVVVFGLAAVLLFAGGPSGWESVRGLVRMSAIALFCAAAIAVAVGSPSSSPLRRVLELPWLRGFGKYSYGLYVIHHLIGPVLVRSFPFASLRGVPAALVTLGFMAWATALTLPIAWASWTLFESRFLKLRSRFEYAKAEAPPAARPLPAPVADVA